MLISNPINFKIKIKMFSSNKIIRMVKIKVKVLINKIKENLIRIQDKIIFKVKIKI
jgi:hypothetical protein